MFILNKNRRKKIQMRVRARVTGTAVRPRLSVFKSNKHVYAQLIDDDNGVTLAAASTLTASLKDSLTDKSPVDSATEVGKEVAPSQLKPDIVRSYSIEMVIATTALSSHWLTVLV